MWTHPWLVQTILRAVCYCIITDATATSVDFKGIFDSVNQNTMSVVSIQFHSSSAVVSLVTGSVVPTRIGTVQIGSMTR